MACTGAVYRLSKSHNSSASIVTRLHGLDYRGIRGSIPPDSFSVVTVALVGKAVRT
jgi:hypothetical protein